MIKLLSTEMMRAGDAATINGGVSSQVLMRRAAEAIFNAYSYKGKIAVVSGLGNNGGDGFALSEVLMENNIKHDVYTFIGKMSEDAGYYYKRLIEKGIDIKIFDKATSFQGYDIVIDCIFGTGLKRNLSGVFEEAVIKINQSGAYIISADIPSGLCGDSGRVKGVSVRADLTVSIGDYKTGHFLNDGKDYTGRLTNCDIGIKTGEGYGLIEEHDIKPFFTKRKNNINKGDAGKLLIIGGCSRYMGAVMLAENGAAALNTGAGLNTIAIPKSFIKEMLTRITSSTLYPIEDNDGFMQYDSDILEEALMGIRAVAFGMGMGKNPENFKYLKYLLDKDMPLLIDADGLNALSDDISILRGHKGDVVLTPHPKEFARLTGLTIEEILNNPIKTAKDFAWEYKVTLLLKGVTTVITDGEKVFLSDSGSPNLAKGGSGDVLSGIIGGLLARGIKPFDAAWAGAYINGRAGELAAEEYGEYSAGPKETAEKIYKVILSVNKEC